MPTWLFTLQGNWSACPQTGGLLASGAIKDSSPISEQVTLQQKNEGSYQLTVDSPVVVDFGGCTNASVIMIVADRKIDVTLTSADGTAQVIPVDGRLDLISRSVPYTAISLTRVAAQLTNVNVFVGMKA